MTDQAAFSICLLYTSDAADDLLCVDLGGRRIIKKKKTHDEHNKIRTHSNEQVYITRQYMTTP